MFNRLDYLKIFCVAAQHRTFRDAALKLNVSPQVVTRCIKELETELGEILFVRSTRNIKITTFGEQFYEKARTALAVINDVFQENPHEDIPIRITAPPSFARSFIVPLLAKISLQYPEFRYDLRLTNRISDVVEDKIDIGVRAGRPISDNRFIAKAVSKINHVVVATPELIARTKTPEQIEDLHHLPVTTMFDNNRNQPWEWFFKEDKTFQPTAPVFVADDADAELEAVLCGIGFGQIAVAVVAPYIRSGKLIPVLTEFELDDVWDVFIYRPQSGPVPPRVRIVFDALVEHFRDPAFFPTKLLEITAS